MFRGLSDVSLFFERKPRYIMDIVMDYEDMNPDDVEPKSELQALVEEAATELERGKSAKAAPKKGAAQTAGKAGAKQQEKQEKQEKPMVGKNASADKRVSTLSTRAQRAMEAGETAAVPVDRLMEVDANTALRERVLQHAREKTEVDLDEEFSDFEEFAACCADGKGSVDDYRRARHDELVAAEEERRVAEAEAALEAEKAARAAAESKKAGGSTGRTGGSSTARTPGSAGANGGSAPSSAGTEKRSRDKHAEGGAEDGEDLASSDEEGEQTAGTASKLPGGQSSEAPSCQLEELSLPLTGLTYGDLLALLFHKNRSLKRLDVSRNADMFLSHVEAPASCGLEELRMEQCSLSAAEVKLVFRAFEQGLKAFSACDNPTVVLTREGKKKKFGEDEMGGESSAQPGADGGVVSGAPSGRRSSFGGGRRNSFQNGAKRIIEALKPTFRRPSQLHRACQSRDGALVDVLDIPWHLGYIGLAGCEIATSQDFVDLAWNFLADDVFLDFSRNPELGVQGLALLLYVLRGRAACPDGYPCSADACEESFPAGAGDGSNRSGEGAASSSAASRLEAQRVRVERLLHAKTAAGAESIAAAYGASGAPPKVVADALRDHVLSEAELKKLTSRRGKSIYATQKGGGFPHRRLRDCVIDYRGCVKSAFSGGAFSCEEAMENFAAIVRELEDRWGVIVVSELNEAAGC